MIDSESIYRLQKDGEYRFAGLTREESRKAAAQLAKAAMKEDQRNGIESRFGIVRNALGYYYAKALG